MVLGVLLVVWATTVETDVVAVAMGQIRPTAPVRPIQPAEPGTVFDVLVQEGDQVKEGQTVLTMDGRHSNADVLAAQKALAINLAMAAELTRVTMQTHESLVVPSIAAEVPSAIWLEGQRHAAAEMKARQDAQMDLRREASARWLQADAEWTAALRDEQRLANQLLAGQQQLTAYVQLNAEGFLSPLTLAERQRDQSARSDELASQRARVAALHASREAAQARLEALRSEFQARASTELQGLRAQQPLLIQTLTHAQTRHRRSQLVSPVNGVVKDLAVGGSGQILAAGSTVMNVVPDAVLLKAEVWLGHQDIGQVAVGQAARVKLVAFPFQRHGWIDGRITRLAPDVSLMQDDVAKHGYRAEIQLSPPPSLGEPISVRSGMAVQAEIVLARRTLLSYALSPIMAVGHEAAQER